jgi:sugar/nucleoside kinase (ribokinase family)
MPRFPDHFVFVCGAHMDQIIRLNDGPVFSVSNPATIELSPGGAALNSASIAAGLGLKTTLVSPIGEDASGQLLRTVCRNRNIGDALVVVEAGATGIYSAILDPAGSVVIGAADLSVYDSIHEPWIETNLADLKHMRSGIFITANLQPHLIKTACAGFGTIAAVTISPAKAVRLAPLLSDIDILFTNCTEANVLIGETGAPGDELAGILFEKGVGCGVISDSGDPLWLWDGDRVQALTPPEPEAIVDVNGAGDALAGACLAALAKGLPMDQAVGHAMEIATATLAHSGPFPPDPSRTLKPVP